MITLRAARSSAHLSGVLLGGAVSLVPVAAAAYDVQADAEVIGQGYQLRAADRSIVDRRRLTTYVGLSLWNLGEKDSEGLPTARNQWNVTLSLRFDTDLGNYLCNIGRPTLADPLDCQSRNKGGSETSPELNNNRPELLFGYLEGKNLFGLLDLRLGRQIQWDLFDLRAFDGIWAEVRTPVFLAVEAWGGENVTGELPIDSPIYSLDGTSHTAQNQALQPTFGFAVRSFGFRDFQARLSYRQSYSLTQDAALPGCPLDATGNPSPCAPDGRGIIEQQLSYSLRGRLLDGRLIGWGGLRYDFVNGKFDQGNIGLRGYLQPQHSLSLEYVYDAPTWDGDSIFNVFATFPYNDLRLTYDGRAGDYRFTARLFGRRFSNELTRTQIDFPDGISAGTFAYGGTAGARMDRRSGFLRFDFYYDGGYGGLRTGADLSGRLLLLRNALGLEGRLTYVHFADGQRGNVDSLGLQAGVRYAITRGVLAHLLLEDNINRLYYSQLRLVALLDLSYYLGQQSAGNAPLGLTSAGMGNYPPARTAAGGW